MENTKIGDKEGKMVHMERNWTENDKNGRKEVKMR